MVARGREEEEEEEGEEEGEGHHEDEPLDESDADLLLESVSRWKVKADDAVLVEESPNRWKRASQKLKGTAPRHKIGSQLSTRRSMTTEIQVRDD